MFGNWSQQYPGIYTEWTPHNNPSPLQNVYDPLIFTQPKEISKNKHMHKHSHKHERNDKDEIFLIHDGKNWLNNTKKNLPLSFQLIVGPYATHNPFLKTRNN